MNTHSNHNHPPSSAHTTTDPLLIAATEHAWSWFELHASQRMQFINHYMIAIAFLGTAYTTALVAAQPLHVPAGLIALIGLGITVFFFFAERRVRRLIHDGEESLVSLEEAITSSLRTNYPGVDLNIVKRAERSGAGEWKYSSVFGWMYGGFGIAALNAALHGLTVARATWEWHTACSLMALGALLFAQTNFERKSNLHHEPHATRESGTKGIFGCLLLVAGLALAIYLGNRIFSATP
jgi:hypothetical protein